MADNRQENRRRLVDAEDVAELELDDVARRYVGAAPNVLLSNLANHVVTIDREHFDPHGIVLVHHLHRVASIKLEKGWRDPFKCRSFQV